MTIYATNPDQTLILLNKNGKAKKIGFVTHTKSINADGTISNSKTVYFYYGTTNFDCFVFENKRLKSHVISWRSPAYMMDIYTKCVSTPDITIKEFINTVAEEYTATEIFSE